MLAAHKMMDAVNLPLQERPHALDPLTWLKKFLTYSPAPWLTV
jgi:hypothetical protein